MAIRYWVAAGPGDWQDTANWGITSGGAGGQSVAGAGDTAIFDAGGPGDCALQSSVQAESITIQPGYTGQVSPGVNNLEVDNDLIIQAGTWNRGIGTITMRPTGTSVLSANGEALETIEIDGPGTVEIGSPFLTAGIQVRQGALDGNGQSIEVEGDVIFDPGTAVDRPTITLLGDLRINGNPNSRCTVTNATFNFTPPVTTDGVPVPGYYEITDADISGSTATGDTVDARGSTDLGGNTGFGFVNQVISLRESGGDYDNLAAAEAGAISDDTIEISGPWTSGDTSGPVITNKNLSIVAIGESKYNYANLTSTYRYQASTSSGMIEMTGANTLVVDGLRIAARNVVSSEAFRLSGSGDKNLTVRNSYLHTALNSGTSQQDAVYFDGIGGSSTVTFENVQADSWGRGVFDLFNVSGNHFININSCSFHNICSFGESRGALVGATGGATVTINVFNTFYHAGGKNSIYAVLDNGGVTPFVANFDHFIHNDIAIYSDFNVTLSETNVLTQRVFRDDDPGVGGSWVICEDLATLPRNLDIQDNPFNNPQDLHADATSPTTGLSMPATDMQGTVRPQNTLYDVGAFETVSLTTRTIGPSTGTYADMPAAVADAVDGDTLLIVDPGVYSGWSTNKNLIYTATPLLQTEGVPNQAGKAKIAGGGGGSGLITLSGTGTSDFIGLEIQQTDSVTSSEAIRVDNNSTLDIDSCMIYGPDGGPVSQQDGIYADTASCSFNITNSIIYGWGRGGIAAFNTSTNSQNIKVNACTIYDCGALGEVGSGCISVRNPTSGAPRTVNIDVFNSLLHASGFNSTIQKVIAVVNFATKSVNVDHVVTNENTISNTDTIKDQLSSRNFTDIDQGAAGNWVVVENVTARPFDLRLKDNFYSDAQDVHLDASSAGTGLDMPTLDIVGTTRPQNTFYDIGAFEVVVETAPEITVHPDGPPTYDYDNLPDAVNNVAPGEKIIISGSWPAADPVVGGLVITQPNVVIEAIDEARFDPANAGGNHYRLHGSGDHVITITASGRTTLDGWEVKQVGAGSSDEGIRVNTNATVDMKAMHIWSDNLADDQDGIYVPRNSVQPTLNLESCYIHSWSRRCVGADDSSTASGDLEININSCVIYDGGLDAAEPLAGAVVHFSSTTRPNNRSVYNLQNNLLHARNGFSFACSIQTGTETNFSQNALNIGNSIISGVLGVSIDNQTNNLESAAFIDTVPTGTGNEVYLEDLAAAPFDLRIKDDANNDAQDYHANATEYGQTIPDVDIVGTVRPQNVLYDVGAFEIPGIVSPWLFADDFEGAVAETYIQNWTPTIVGDFWALQPTSPAQGLAVRTGGGLGSDAESGAIIFPELTSADHEVYGRWLADSNHIYICVRFVDNSNWLGFKIHGEGALGLRVVREDNGIQTELFTGPWPGNYNVWYRLSADGDKFALHTAGEGDEPGDLTLLWEETGTPGISLTETSVGVFADQAVGGNVLDDFRADLLSVPPPPQGNIRLGSSQLQQAYLGSTVLSQLYLGATPLLGGYSIAASCVFDGSTEYHFRDFDNTQPDSSQLIKTHSLWFKRGTLGNQCLQCLDRNAGDYYFLEFSAGNNLSIVTFENASEIGNLQTAQQFTDTDWHHLVLAVDTTQAVAADRVRLYIDGLEITNWASAVYPAQNAEFYSYLAPDFGGTQLRLGNFRDDTRQFDGQLGEIHIVDGQQLTDDDFGEQRACWSAKAYQGTYGVNGQYIDYRDGANMGEDYSGNGLTHTLVGIDATNRSTDVPTCP